MSKNTLFCGIDTAIFPGDPVFYGAEVEVYGNHVDADNEADLYAKIVGRRSEVLDITEKAKKRK